jgi:hypothetical protein
MPENALSDPTLTSWPVYTATDRLDPDALSGLVAGELAAIHIPAFEDANACAAIVEAAKAHGFEWYENVTPPIGKIGVVQVGHSSDAGKRQYFETAPVAAAARDRIMAAGNDPFARLLALLADTWATGAGIAREPGSGADYFAGVIRNMTTARLHCDWAPHEASGWTVGSIIEQLAWNVYLKIGAHGGQTRVYDRAWSEECEAFKTAGNYGYEPEVVAGSDFIEIQPGIGDLLIFSPRRFHEVICPDDGAERIAIGSFVGVTSTDEPLILWS